MDPSAGVHTGNFFTPLYTESEETDETKVNTGHQTPQPPTGRMDTIHEDEEEELAAAATAEPEAHRIADLEAEANAKATEAEALAAMAEVETEAGHITKLEAEADAKATEAEALAAMAGAEAEALRAA